jgi:hypothetical protein
MLSYIKFIVSHFVQILLMEFFIEHHVWIRRNVGWMAF